jgi:hypothetical protein
LGLAVDPGRETSFATNSLTVLSVDRLAEHKHSIEAMSIDRAGAGSGPPAQRRSIREDSLLSTL